MDGNFQEDEALDETRKALDFSDSKPPATISIPSTIAANQNNVQQQAGDRKSILLTVTDHTCTTTTTTVTTATPMSTIVGSSSLEGDHDATVGGCGGGAGPTSQITATFSMEEVDDHQVQSHKPFYIGGNRSEQLDANDDEEISIQSKVSLLETDEMSHGELIDLVERLYDNLKNADRALTKEKARRSGREKSLIKLAKELRKRKEMVADCMERIEELELELQVVRSERDLMEQRLDYHLELDRTTKDDERESLLDELAQAQELYRETCTEYKTRIKELNKSHAEQCDQLCREVIISNREVVRLQTKLSEVFNEKGSAAYQDGTVSIHNPPSHYYLSPPRSPSNTTAARRYRWNRLIRIAKLVFAIIATSLLVCSKQSDWSTVKGTVKERISSAIHASERIFFDVASPQNTHRETTVNRRPGLFISEMHGHTELLHRNVKSDVATSASGKSIKDVGNDKGNISSGDYGRSVMQKFILPIRRLCLIIKRIVLKLADKLKTVLAKLQP